MMKKLCSSGSLRCETASAVKSSLTVRLSPVKFGPCPSWRIVDELCKMKMADNVEVMYG
jgi:hypothetical protein